jgi:uncharacterized protein YbbK (DUF523 family)
MQKILVSACLLGYRVRHDGQHSLLRHPILERWQRQGRLVAFCPEVAGGLATPRPVAEISQRFPILVTDSTGEDLTPAFLNGAELALEVAQRENCCCALLKAHSPSCGSRQVYDGQFRSVLVQGSGIAAAELMRHGFAVYDETQLDELAAFIDALESSAEARENSAA